MSTKRYKLSLLGISFIFILASPVYAVTSSSITITSYKFTITNLQISRDNGQTWTAVYSGSKLFNPASVSSGLVDYLLVWKFKVLFGTG